ncbi:conserved hypothetical protein [Vibrio nigripulchritudo SO65]|uniref:hypothetical protein n=1 Tax=Vibrio nigripulchritudo TaxID=28173 RepID=UPI0003B1F30D|nr:hypothetical protein [Vibrio nigripulchritudo]CCN37506.1 conserved hypothetical protein [Vibrio nigripulchritudo AM115]CCN41676.1 conserved hypothetical protein [Vibrio nigripulchritudo FTn2]CCN63374.1 conserved hypothetical protein [Vibrio nigripulchritudo POn4]CCN75270.1 conserved hypothetical protein [Vibrio nigripulchritudo SO65]
MEAMDNKFDQLMRKEQRKAKLKKLCGLVAFLSFFSCIVYIYVVTAPNSSFKVIGVVKSKHTLLREDGHFTYLFVEVPNEINLVKAKLPSKHPIKLNTKVELLVQQARYSESYRYTFLKYVEN